MTGKGTWIEDKKMVRSPNVLEVADTLLEN